MAGADESLVLAARVVDAFSPTLKDLQRSLRSIAATTKQTHSESTKYAKDHTAALSELKMTLTQTGERVRSVFTPALAAMGVGALSAAAGIAAIKSAITDFADASRSLTFAQRATALTIDQLRTLQALGPRIGTSAESMTRGLEAFSGQMEKLKRLGPTLGPLNELRQLQQSMGVRPSGALRDLVESLQHLPREQQLETVLKFLDHIQDMGQRKALLQAFGLDPALANKSAAEILRDINDIRKNLGPLSEEARQKGLRAAEGFDHLRESIEGLRTAVGAGLADDIAKVTNTLADFVSAHGDEIVRVLKDTATWIKQADWAGFASDVRGAATAINAIVQSTTGWKPLLEFLAAYKLAQILGVTAAVRGLAGAFGLLSAVTAPPAWLLGLLGVGGSAAAGVAGAGVALSELARRLSAEGQPGGAKGDEFRDPLSGAPLRSPAMPPGATFNERFKLQSYRSLEGARPPLTPISYTPGGGANPLTGQGGAGSPAARVLELAVRKGVYDGLWDFVRGQPSTGGVGGGVGAIRANYSPGGGAGGGTGEPATGGGAGTTGGVASAPMGSLRGFGKDAGGLGGLARRFGLRGLPHIGALSPGGGLPAPRGGQSYGGGAVTPALPGGVDTGVGPSAGPEGLSRTFNPPNIPSGMGGMVADQFKAGGISLPAAIDAKIRGGGQITANDLASLPPGQLEKANKAVIGMGQPPLYSDKAPQHFSLGDIRNSLKGTAAAGGGRQASLEPGIGAGGGAGAGGGGLPDTGGYGGMGRRGLGGAINLPGGPSAANSYIAAQRAGFAKELQDPQFRSQFAAMLQAEGPNSRHCRISHESRGGVGPQSS